MAGEVVVDQERFDTVCDLLVSARRNNEFPYRIAQRPQDIIPEKIRKDPLIYARVLFGICYYMRGTIRSEYAIRRMVNMYETHPELFDPSFLSNKEITEEWVFERMKVFVKFRLFEIIPMWLDGFRRLQEDWGGDPIRLFDGVTESQELYRRIVNRRYLAKAKWGDDKLRGFVGMREKIANMLAYFLIDAKLIKPVETSSPFDFHNGRILIACGAIVLKGDGPFRFEDVTGIGSAAVKSYAQRRNVPMVTMSDALWFPSVTLCRRAPGNRTMGRNKRKLRNRHKRHLLTYKPQKRARQKLKKYQPDWSKQQDVHIYELTCGRCPLNKANLCALNVAAGFFYEKGEFVTQPRTKPVQHLFVDGLEYHKNGNGRSHGKKAKRLALKLPTLPGLKLHRQKKKKSKMPSNVSVQ